MKTFLLPITKRIGHVIQQQAFLAVLTIIGAHGLAFLLVQILPTTANIMLGFYSVQEDVFAALASLTESRPYLEMLKGLLTLDFGVSADGVPVKDELYRHLLISLPRISVALLAAAVMAVISAFAASRSRLLVLPVLSYLLFFPVYGIPFLVFVFLLLFNADLDPISPLLWLACTVAISVSPSAMLAAQSFSIMQSHLNSRHAMASLALGIPIRRLRWLLMRNVIFEVSPTFEKIMTGTVTGLMFSEMVLGLPGLGVLAIRAIRRSDVELLLGIVVVFSALICVARLFSAVIISCYRTKS